MPRFESHQNKVSAESVPKTLIEYDGWVCWRYDQGGNKKPPYDPETEKNASIHQPETWADFETALEAYQRDNYDGIGFILTEDGALTGFDFDDCRDPETGEIESEVEDIIERLDSYSEISPSGTGIHTLIIGEKPDEYGCKDGAHIEVYDSARYFTVTGDRLEGTPATIEPRCEELQAICEEYLTENPSQQQTEFAELPEDSGNAEEIEEAREYIRDFLYATETGPRPPDYFTDLLKGRYVDRGFEGDRSGAETTLCTLTYGIFLDGGAEPEHARELTYHYITHAALENPYTTSKGKVRKWLEGSLDQHRNYRQRTLDYAIKNFDPEIWSRWRQSGKRTTTDDYCEHAYEVALDALCNLTVEHATLANPPTLSTNNTPDSCGYPKRENPYPTLRQIAERAQEEYGLSEDSYREILRRIRRDGGAKMARLGSSTYVYYPATYPDPPDACYVRVEGEKREPESESAEEAPEPEVMTDGGTPMSDTESHDKLEQIRRAKSSKQNQSNGPEILICPLCDQPMLPEGPLRNHVSQSRDADHQGITLDDSLEPVEKHKVEDILREQYVEKGRTLKELEERWGVSRGTIHYWLDKYDIERRPHLAVRVERATFYTDLDGYEQASARTSSGGEEKRIRIHQLVACLNHDPAEVFDPDTEIHHRNGVPWDNREKNLELLWRAEHQRAHRKGEWTEEDGVPVLVTQQVEDSPRWGPGTRSSREGAEKESIYAEDDPWGPGAPV